jgi:hypothetical protein
MIKTDDIFDDFSNMSALWVDDTISESCDLARVSDFIVNKNISVVSLPVSGTEQIWPWIEKQKVRIFNRLNIELDENIDATISSVARKITESFRCGANGIQIMIEPKDLQSFVNSIIPIKNDLFFDRDLVIGMDVNKICTSDWPGVFNLLNQIQSNAILINVPGDKFDASSDFIGRIYAMFENWNFDGELHLMFGKNMMRYSQVLRLAQKMRPAVATKILAFMQY